MLYLFVVLSVLCGACSTEGIYYVRPADVSTCQGQPCHNLTYYSENSQLYFTSNTTLYFLPGEHILGHVIVTDVSNITLAGIVSSEHTILRCPGEGGILFMNCKEIYLLQLTFSNCGADYGTSIYRGLGFQCVTDLEISNIVVTNSTGFGLAAVNVVGSVHIQNSVFTYNTGSIGGNAKFQYSADLQCPQVTDTLLFIENSFFAYGENWSTQYVKSSAGGMTLAFQSSFNIIILVTNTTLHGNKVAIGGGGNMVIYYNSNGACNCVSVTIEHCYITQGEASDGGGLYIKDIRTTEEPHHCGTTEPHSLHITDVQFVNNTAHRYGGGVYILDGSSVGSNINITNSSIIGGKAEGGGALYVHIGKPRDHMESKGNDSEYCNTHATRIGVCNCDIQNNIATGSGGGLVIAIFEFNNLTPQSFHNILVTNTTLHGNQAPSGGGGNMVIYYSKEAHNLVSVTIEHCYITQGQAQKGGGLYVGDKTEVPYQCSSGELQHTLHITDVQFVNNTARNNGGGVYILDGSSVGNHINITNSSITGGQAQQGGGVYVQIGKPRDHMVQESKWNDSEYHCNTPATRMNVWNCDIQNNFATDSGGGLVLLISEFDYVAPQSSLNIDIILVTNTTLHGNQAPSGGGGNMVIYYNKEAHNLVSVTIEHCYITQGGASNGGGLFIQDIRTTKEPHQYGTGEPHALHITNVQFVSNTAHNNGGSIFIKDDSNICNHINICNSSIISGQAAGHGGGVFVQMGKPRKNPIIDSEHCSNTPITRFTEKRWTFWNCDIRNNSAEEGGGISLGISEFKYFALLVDFIDVRFIGNTATPSEGGGHVSIDDFVGNGGVVFVRFQKVYFGYGVVALDISVIADVSSVRQVELWKCTFETNTTRPDSIRLYSFTSHINPATSAFRIIFRNVTFINTPIQVSWLSNVTFINSTFRDSSTYSSLTAISSEIRFQGYIAFENNSGYDGGALALFGGSKMILMPQTEVLFIGNHATHAGGALMVYDESLRYKDYCFYHINSNHEIKGISLIFDNNTAEYAGDAIFGGSIQRCIQPVIKVSQNGSSTQYQWFQLKQNIYSLLDIQQEGLSVISSQPYRACLCENYMPNCSRAELIKHLHPGGTFAVSAVVVGQMNGTVPGVVHADFVNLRQSSLSGFQTLQGTERVCTTLRYTVYSNAHLASLRLRAENTSRISGSILRLDLMEEPHVSIHLLSCPPGFAFGNTGERQLGKCDCHPQLFRLELNISCNITDQTMYRPSSLWIGQQLRQANTSDVMYQLCPFDYCKLRPASTKLNESDQQCNFNRYGILCGACSTTYSLMLGGSRCSKCNEWYPLPVLLVAFAILGVLLVAFLTLCNLTVSEGTINGLIFYANIVHTTRSIFFPSESLTAPFAIFIAWLNLDFGFEVCFYSGMDTYSKTWLQFVFPAYIWLIAFLMIVSSHYSATAAKLIGRNATKILATLFLLSFAKLQRTIIAALSFTFLNFLDGSRKKVWVYDGNINYLEGRHIPLFLAGLLAFIFLLLPYTLVLTFIQHLRRRTGTRMLFWVRRLKPFFDAYTGPYKDRYSFWVGLLLLVRSSLFLVFAFNALGDPAMNLLATTLTGFLLAIVLQGLHGVYKSWPLNTLESLSFLNLGILSLATLYVRNAGGNQTVLASISVGIAFFTFAAILFYHMTFTRIWRRLVELYSQRKRRGETREMAEMETIGEQVIQPQVRTVELQFDQYCQPFLADVTS